MAYLDTIHAQVLEDLEGTTCFLSLFYNHITVVTKNKVHAIDFEIDTIQEEIRRLKGQG